MENDNKHGGLINRLISLLIIIATVYHGYSAAIAAGDDRMFLEATFFILLAVIFCLSYFRTSWLVLFGFLVWLCKTWSFPQKRIMTLVYSGVFFTYGGWLFYKWLF